jgi:hypothetical protein
MAMKDGFTITSISMVGISDETFKAVSLRMGIGEDTIRRRVEEHTKSLQNNRPGDAEIVTEFAREGIHLFQVVLNHGEKSFSVGARVKATVQITERGDEDKAEASSPNFIHAEKGEAGTVGHVAGHYVTVRFDRTGTAATVVPREIEPLESSETYGGLASLFEKRREEGQEAVAMGTAIHEQIEKRLATTPGMTLAEGFVEQVLLDLGSMPNIFDCGCSRLKVSFGKCDIYDETGKERPPSPADPMLVTEQAESDERWSDPKFVAEQLAKLEGFPSVSRLLDPGQAKRFVELAVARTVFAEPEEDAAMVRMNVMLDGGLVGDTADEVLEHMTRRRRVVPKLGGLVTEAETDAAQAKMETVDPGEFKLDTTSSVFSQSDVDRAMAIRIGEVSDPLKRDSPFRRFTQLSDRSVALIEKAIEPEGLCCKKVEGRLAFGWGCGKCKTFNGMQRFTCKNCEHVRDDRILRDCGRFVLLKSTDFSPRTSVVVLALSGKLHPDAKTALDEFLMALEECAEAAVVLWTAEADGELLLCRRETCVHHAGEEETSTACGLELGVIAGRCGVAKMNTDSPIDYTSQVEMTTCPRCLRRPGVRPPGMLCICKHAAKSHWQEPGDTDECKECDCEIFVMEKPHTGLWSRFDGIELDQIGQEMLGSMERLQLSTSQGDDFHRLAKVFMPDRVDPNALAQAIGVYRGGAYRSASLPNDEDAREEIRATLPVSRPFSTGDLLILIAGELRISLDRITYEM